jgi:uncharacterized protein YbbC (DUF1343 family)
MRRYFSKFRRERTFTAQPAIIAAMAKVQPGLDVLLDRKLGLLKGNRVGLICHQASVDSRLRHAVPLMLDKKVHLTALFGPEHGMWGTAQDQIELEGEKDAAITLPIYSLYGNHRHPSPESLQAIDILVCDLQDVGSRYYTFIWTMALAMQACAKQGKKFIVLDRPNPINGKTLEGPLLDPRFASFVGLYPVPVRHGMTIGEIALWLNEGFGMGADLEVIPMAGWKRAMSFEATGLPWVLPSPNMPTVETAWVYPGGCLIEGTQLSEGRGTTRPFELVGAPYIQPDTLASALNGAKLPGVVFRACRFEPTFHKFDKQLCGGVQVHVTDRVRFQPFFTYLAAIQYIRELYPRDFAWRNPPYEYETEKLPFDILCGTDRIRKALESGGSLRPLARSWDAELAAFDRQRKPFLLYN